MKNDNQIAIIISSQQLVFVWFEFDIYGDDGKSNPK